MTSPGGARVGSQIGLPREPSACNNLLDSEGRLCE